ncbi:hypothetical protein PoMZ_01961 [Pyricularia oryzae]|uniref:Uncharacterized protein n=1 Tax=Pyricularia oryzae TaxID=318829 RepID=A0A4P7N639_PYROR|nr:hypothetical protein PoMZ_01961 [Pyricularia oryzae]
MHISWWPDKPDAPFYIEEIPASSISATDSLLARATPLSPPAMNLRCLSKSAEIRLSVAGYVSRLCGAVSRALPVPLPERGAMFEAR